MRSFAQFVRWAVLALAAWGACGFVAPAAAQDFRGSITGRVSDAQGGRLPGATVTAVNVDTNVTATSTTDASGDFAISYLTAGTYRLTVEIPGFKKAVRDKIEVRIGDRLSIDVSLEVGQLEETVTVAAETPLLETRSGSAGQVIGEKQIALMPLSDGNPFVLARLAPGVAYHGDLKFSRPFDNAGTSDFTADGGPGRNEFTLDGSPNMTHGRRVAFVPPANAVQEFKVETATFDAQQGHTAGATVNVTLKSGTNVLRGDGYYHYRDEALSGNDFFLERAGRPKDALDYKRYGFSAGGPVIKSKTFFFSAFEWLPDQFPEPGQFTVPTAAQRNGDFSALLSQGVVIYDPLTAVRRADGRVERQPFPNNVIPSQRLSPIAREVLRYYPLPNQAGDAQGRNNYISGSARGDDFYTMNYRVDHTLNDKQRFFVRYSRNDRQEYRGNWIGEIDGIRPIGNYLFRINDALNVDHVWTMTPSSLLNVRASWSRFQEPNVRQHQNIFDPASLGFPPSTAQYFGSNKYFPNFNFDDNQFADIGQNFAGQQNSSIYSFQPTWTLMRGAHSFRTGYDFRTYLNDQSPDVHSAGRYDFARNAVLTRQLDNSPAAAIGQDLAAFLLGYPSGGTIDRSADRFNKVLYQGLFFQDDWKVGAKLTLNLGIRWEYESGPVERSNRNVRGFDPDAVLNITSAAQAAYAASPIPEIPASAFRVRGGLMFADDGNRQIVNADMNNVQPRAGFAYQASDKTVVRGGWAIYAVPSLFDLTGIYQPGFSQGTSIVPTLDNGVTIRATLANPFPDGVADPPGASLGPNTFLGRAIGRFNDQLDYRNGQSMRWVLSVQRELPGQWLVEGAYVASRSYDLTTDYNLNPVPRQYLSTSSVRDDATINYLTANVANPFRGLLPGETLNGNTAQRQQLLRPYPQFQNIDVRRYDGSSHFDSLQGRVTRRFRGGYMLDTSYTWSDFKEKVTRLNDTDGDYEERFQDTHLRHRLVVNGIWELPFGHNRRWGKEANPIVNGVIGDWSLSFIWNWQSGRPNLTMGNVYYDGDITKLTTKYTDDPTVPVFDTSGFYFHDAAVQTNGVDDPAKQRADQRIRLANNVRTIPSRWDGLRGPRFFNWDMSFVKGFDFGRIRAQIHLELYNAFNNVFYNNPNLDPTSSDFGKVNSQNNVPRNIQIGTKIVF
ncbi:MAG TPA: carboxypeptidase regulatory-like domain-containing protein [Vicinamibacterales bacterium]|nr:carboxypeptidase regulatory-like domain-containing protein [Vicinamibacterales bacterium]